MTELEQLKRELNEAKAELATGHQIHNAACSDLMDTRKQLRGAQQANRELAEALGKLLAMQDTGFTEHAADTPLSDARAVLARFDAQQVSPS